MTNHSVIAYTALRSLKNSLGERRFEKLPESAIRSPLEQRGIDTINREALDFSEERVSEMGEKLAAHVIGWSGFMRLSVPRGGDGAVVWDDQTGISLRALTVCTIGNPNVPYDGQGFLLRIDVAGR